MLLFADPRYGTLAESLRESYARAEPFPNVVIDEFLPENVCRKLLEEFPGPRDIDWIRFSSSLEIKLASKDESQFKPFTRQVFYEFNSASFLKFLEKLTGIPGLVPDPYFQGGGWHQIEPGGFLKIHADFNIHPQLNLDRRLNLLLYLNPNWKEEYGGHVELWDPTMSRCVRKILPIFNRFVLFNTTDRSYHGHPEPLACPAGMTRKSIALYYYTNGRPLDEIAPGHSTLFQTRPVEKGIGMSSTVHWIGRCVPTRVKRAASDLLMNAVRNVYWRRRLSRSKDMSRDQSMS